jgi:hypothetical protein
MKRETLEKKRSEIRKEGKLWGEEMGVKTDLVDHCRGCSETISNAMILSTGNSVRETTEAPMLTIPSRPAELWNGFTTEQ